MPKGHGFALTPYKGALGIIKCDNLNCKRNDFNTLRHKSSFLMTGV